MSAALIDLSCHWLGEWYCARVIPFLTTLVMPMVVSGEAIVLYECEILSEIHT